MKSFKVIGLLALVFIAGFAGGVVATRVMVRRMVVTAMAHPEQTHEVARVRVERNLDRKLRLNPPQRDQVHKILKESRDKVRVVREEFQPQINAIMLDTRTNISAILTSNQQKSFNEFLADNRPFLPLRDISPAKKD